MSIRSSRLVATAAFAVAALSPSSALAATPVSQADGRALVLIPLSLTKINDLDFGAVVPSSSAGTVTINPGNGKRTFTGGVTLVPGDAGFRVYFGGAGTPNQQVLVALSPPVSLSDGLGNSIPVMGLTLDGPPMRTVDPTSRAFFVGVGGTLSIGADQAEGTYSGNFWVTAVYQ